MTVQTNSDGRKFIRTFRVDNAGNKYTQTLYLTDYKVIRTCCGHQGVVSLDALTYLLLEEEVQLFLSKDAGFIPSKTYTKESIAQLIEAKKDEPYEIHTMESLQ